MLVAAMVAVRPTNGAVGRRRGPAILAVIWVRSIHALTVDSGKCSALRLLCNYMPGETVV
jgi:hypothetical protein